LKRAQLAAAPLKAKYPNQLSGRQPIIHRADLGAAGIYYRAFVGPFASPEKAARLCSGLKAAGGDSLARKIDARPCRTSTRRQKERTLHFTRPYATGRNCSHPRITAEPGESFPGATEPGLQVMTFQRRLNERFSFTL